MKLLTSQDRLRRPLISIRIILTIFFRGSEFCVFFFLIFFIISPSAHLNKRSASEALPILLHLVQKGNTTVYEWRTGVEPTSVEKDLNTTLKFGDEEEAAEDTNGEIDFGIDFGTDEAADVNLDQVYLLLDFFVLL